MECLPHPLSKREHWDSYRLSGLALFPQLLLMPGSRLRPNQAASLKYLTNSINLEAESIFFLLDQRGSFYRLKAQRESRCFRSPWAPKAEAADVFGSVGPSHSHPGTRPSFPGFYSALKRYTTTHPQQLCVSLVISLWLFPFTGILQMLHGNPCQVGKPLVTYGEVI